MGIYASNKKESEPTSYKIIKAQFFDEFERKIDKAIENGYELYGYPFTAIMQDKSTAFCQAVINKKMMEDLKTKGVKNLEQAQKINN